MSNIIDLGEHMEKRMKIKIFIATPAYNSMNHTDFTHTMISFLTHGLPVTLMTIGNESLITRGRNTAISKFYTTIDYTHLFFLDADIGMTAQALVRLLSHGKDVIGAPVQLKGKDAKGNPVYNIGDELEKLGNGLSVTNRLGTAVMILSRKAVNALIKNAKKNGDVYYSNPHTRGDAESMTMYDVFKVGVHEKQYLPEDFWACKKLIDLGFKVHVDTGVSVIHNGMYGFGEASS